MKRVLALLVFMSGAVHAQELSETWKQLSQYRVVSGVKAGVVGIGAVQMVYTSWLCAQETGRLFSSDPSLFGWDKPAREKWNKLIGSSAATVGLLYMASKLGWEYFPGYAKHALAIK